MRRVPLLDKKWEDLASKSALSGQPDSRIAGQQVFSLERDMFLFSFNFPFLTPVSQWAACLQSLQLPHLCVVATKRLKQAMPYFFGQLGQQRLTKEEAAVAAKELSLVRAELFASFTSFLRPRVLTHKLTDRGGRAAAPASASPWLAPTWSADRPADLPILRARCSHFGSGFNSSHACPGDGVFLPSGLSRCTEPRGKR